MSLATRLSDLITAVGGDIKTLRTYITGSASGDLSGLGTSSKTSIISAINEVRTGSPVSNNIARGYRSAALALANSVYTKVPIDAISFDPAGSFSTANGRFVAPTNGYYQVNAQALISAGVGVLSSIYKNGTQVSEGTISSTNRSEVSDIIFLAAGDYIELWVWAGAATNLSVGSSPMDNFMSVVQVGVSLASGMGALSSARVTRAAALTIVASGYTKIAFDTKSYDTGNNYSTANTRFTCPAAGRYLVAANIVLSGAATQTQIEIRKNGTAVTDGQFVSSSNGAAVFDIIDCAAGDYLEIWMYNYTASTTSINTGAAFNYANFVQVASGPASSYKTASRAVSTSAQGMVNNAQTKVTLGTKSYDTGSNFSTANSRYVAPVSGYYQVNGLVKASTQVTQLEACLYKNGALYSDGSNHASSVGLFETVNDLVFLAAGDYVELYYYAVISGTPSITGVMSVVLEETA